MNYEQDMKISPSDLDTEWLAQPSLMFKYANICATAEKKKDEAKEQLDFVKAEIDQEIRLDPGKFGLEKIVEKAVENTILSQGRYKTASEEFIQAKYEWNVAKGAVDAVEQRKTALENLVRLHGQNYFAGPKIPRDLASEWEEKQKKSNQIIGRTMTRQK
jgi:hypothetical protein